MRKQLFCLSLVFSIYQLHAQVGIGTATPHTTAQLEISSSNRGLLIPRMTETQRNAIVTPATGLLVFQTDGAAGFYYHNGTTWQQLNPSNNWLLTGNTGNASTHFIGTTDGQPLVFKVGNELVGQIKPGGINLSFGFRALKLSTGTDNTAFGTSALEHNSSGGSNTAIGDGALTFNTTGSWNTATGVEAMYGNTTGRYNTALGYQSLYYNNTTSNNTAIGTQALHHNKVSENTGVGSQALYSNTNGTANTALGFQALYSNLTTSQNTAVGNTALRSNSIGESSTAVGASALVTNTTGSFNTAVGALADVTTSNLTNATAIGYGAKVDASNKVQIGNANVSSIGGQVGWTTFSDGRFKEDVQEDVPGLVFIKSLRPVTYTVNKGKLTSHLRKDLTNTAGVVAREASTSKKRETGFIAQEVEKVAKALGYDFSGVDTPTNDSALYGIRYSEFVMPLVKAVQEQQQMIEVLQNENEAYKEQLKALQDRLEKLEKLINK